MEELPPTSTGTPENEPIPPLDARYEEKGPYFERHPEDIRPGDLNNLHLWLPGSGYLKMIEKALDMKRDSAHADAKNSATWQNQTPREYAQTIVETLDELPEVKSAIEKIPEVKADLKRQIDEIQKRISSLYESLSHLSKEERSAQFSTAVAPLMAEQGRLQVELGKLTVNDLLVPLYRALRNKGYSHYDVVV